jgi:UDP-glucose 4-epimerase
MKVIVTGGCGFIGSHIVDYLIDDGNEVYVIDNLSTGKLANLNKKAEFFNSDIGSDEVREIFHRVRPQVVYHEAAQIDIQKSIMYPVFDAETNISGTVNILNCCRDFGTGKIIYASSAAVYGDPQYLPVDEEHITDPISFYGISKHTPEHYIKVYGELYGLKYTILRYANVYGIRQDPKGEGGVISIFLDKIIKNEPLEIYGDGEQTRDFINVKDVAVANIKALNAGDGTAINISTGKPVSINELFEIIKKISNKELKLQYEDARKGDIKDSFLLNTKAKDILDFVPAYDIEMGIKETMDFYLNSDKKFFRK